VLLDVLGMMFTASLGLFGMPPAPLSAEACVPTAQRLYRALKQRIQRFLSVHASALFAA
jgi:hypothetical protein